MKKLIIVESPSKAKTIQKYLGDDYIVMASGGHVCDLPQRSLGIDVENRFKPEYVVNSDKREIIKRLKNAVKQSDKVYLATDPDREGEAISWHLKNTLEIPDGENRIVFNEISKKAVNEAISKPRELDMKLVDSQQARRVLDRLVGYKISPIISKKIKNGSSAGRVQSVALEMIVDREREIRDFKPEEYWNIHAFLNKENNTLKKNIFKAQFVDFDGKKFKVTNKDDAEMIVNATKGAKFYVDTAKRAISKSRPSPPFTTSTLQQDASQKLSFSAPQTMQIAQQLYEGIDIEGEGATALVTYIRTDSVRVSPDMQATTLSYITDKYGKEFAPKKPNVYKTKNTAQDAHEAIRPISLERTPQSLQNKINRNQYRLYKLIYERYLASQMTDATYNTLTVHITATNEEVTEKKLGYRVNGKVLAFAGYTIVYSNKVEGDDDDDNESSVPSLPDMNKGDVMLLKETTSEQKFTKPPQRYTDATLVKSLEENGIGRPSTYASVISVLSKRNYTTKEARSIIPTQLGEAVNDYMVKFFPDIMDLKFTAKMEGALDKIEEDGMEWQCIIENFYPKFIRSVNNAYRDGTNVKIEDEVSDEVCDKCGTQMVIKEGRYGKFLACPEFPKCRNVKPIIEIIGKCPKCGKGIVKKRTKKGKLFYACVGYPDCDFVSWDLPAPYFCPECNSTMKITTIKNVKNYVCINKSCNHKELVKEVTKEIE